MEYQKKVFYNKLELEKEPKDPINSMQQNEQKEENGTDNIAKENLSSKNINIVNDKIEELEKKIISSIMEKKEIIPIKGNENCAYRAILKSLNEPEDFLTLRKMAAKRTRKDGLDDNYFLERNCNSLEEYANKIESTSFYADEPELRAISKIKKIWITKYVENRNTWKILKNEQKLKPSGIAFICFHDTGNDLSCHYKAKKPIEYYYSKRHEINMSSKKDEPIKKKIILRK